MAQELPRQLVLVSYAVNGAGLGHLSRQIALHRWIRRLAAVLGVHTQHWFLTTSEADTILFHEGFAGFKLPSKSSVEAAGIPKLSYIALAKQWVWHSLALLRPDLLLVDTFPNGSFHELLGALDLCRHKALVLRPVKEDMSSQASFRAMAALYDRVIVPERATDHPEMVTALGLDPRRVAFTGPVMRAEAFERLPRELARARLGAPPEAMCVLVTAGGGGDAGADALMDRAEELLGGDPGVHLVFAAGPLYRGPARRGPRRTWWTSPDLAEHLAGVDAAVCAGGFNTAHELLFAGVATAIAPQRKIADDQAARAAALARVGAALVAPLDDPAAFGAAVAALRDPDRRAALATAARRAVPENHARDAAAEALSLVLPAGALRRAREALDDASLAAVRDLQAPLAEVAELAATLHVGAPRDEVDLEPALELLQRARERGLSAAAVQRLAGGLCRKLRTSRPPSADDVGAAIATLLDVPGLCDQWSAAAMLVGGLAGEREWGPRELAKRVAELVDAGLCAGRDVFAAARAVVEAQTECGDGGGNAALLARARARLLEGAT